jgi:hypothetical protein
MSRLVSKLPDGSSVEFDRGKFDGWCVYLTRPGKLKYAPKDTEYFETFRMLGKVFGNQKVYKDFILIYELTTKNFENKVIQAIIGISDDYVKFKDEICVWFTVIYAGMIAEENKENTVLKKRIKRLGMHQLLVENKEPEFAANFSRGKTWKEIDKVCKEKGF